MLSHCRFLVMVEYLSSIQSQSPQSRSDMLNYQLETREHHFSFLGLCPQFPCWSKKKEEEEEKKVLGALVSTFLLQTISLRQPNKVAGSGFNLGRSTSTSWNPRDLTISHCLVMFIYLIMFYIITTCCVRCENGNRTCMYPPSVPSFLLCFSNVG